MSDWDCILLILSAFAVLVLLTGAVMWAIVARSKPEPDWEREQDEREKGRMK